MGNPAQWLKHAAQGQSLGKRGDDRVGMVGGPVVDDNRLPVRRLGGTSIRASDSRFRRRDWRDCGNKPPRSKTSTDPIPAFAADQASCAVAAAYPVFLTCHTSRRAMPACWESADQKNRRCGTNWAPRLRKQFFFFRVLVNVPRPFTAEPDRSALAHNVAGRVRPRDDFGLCTGWQKVQVVEMP